MRARGFADNRAWIAVAVAAGAMAMWAALPARAVGPHQKKPVAVRTEQRTEYAIVQDKKKVGSEKVDKKVFDNNTILFTIDADMTYGVGVTMVQHCELTVEEESYYPRSLHITKTVHQPDGKTFEHKIDVEMFSNVAVVTSTLNDVAGGKNLVVPTGVPIEDLGILGYLYQTLFWYDRETGGEQRFQWLDPIGLVVNSGTIKLDPDTTIAVMKKKIPVSAYRVERDKIGPASLWVDKDGVIVRAEMNFFTYELIGKKTS